MYLIIDTADSDTLVVGVADESTDVALAEESARHQQSEKLLPAILNLLKKQKQKLSDVSGIICVIGPGPFTALRIGVTTANTLSYSLQVPIIGFKQGDFKNYQELAQNGIKKIKKSSPTKLLEPFYDKQPNITKKKI